MEITYVDLLGSYDVFGSDHKLLSSCKLVIL